MCNSVKHFISTTLCCLFCSLMPLSDAKANIFNNFRQGFYFEKYSTAQEAKEELLKLYPIGSDSVKLIRTLEKSGAIVTEENLEGYKKFKEYDKWWKMGVKNMYVFKYEKASPFFVILNYLIWNGSVQTDENGKIIFIGISKNRAY